MKDGVTNKNNKVRFNTEFLTDFNKDVDLSWLVMGQELRAGKHSVAIYVNGKKIKTLQTKFVEDAEGAVVPCIPQKVFSYLNLDQKRLPPDWHEKACINIAATLKGATANYNYDDETLQVTIPQIYFIQGIEGMIPPSRWDEGINAMSLNYSLSGTSGISRYGDYSAWYGDLNTLLRLGAWRVATLDTFSGGSQNKHRIQHLQSYAQRAIGSSLSELTLGNFNTSGSLFATVPLTGVRWQSDERMLPWTMKGYAPQIRGVANSNAVITIKQNNSTLYERNIPPGEFNITDLNTPGYGGNLEVTIRESDGTIKTFNVPYSSLPQLVRKERFIWSLAGGQVRRYGYTYAPELFESTLRYGFTDNVTLYGGVQATTDNAYQGISSGAAFNTLLGAVSVDVYQSESRNDTRKSGSLKDKTKIRVGLAKQLSETKTFLALSGYHHLGDKYYTLDDYMVMRETARGEETKFNRYRNSVDVSLNQLLPDEWGDVALTGLWESNNDSAADGSRSTWVLSYRNNYDSINYNLSMSKALTAQGKEETSFYAAFSIPLAPNKIFPPTLRTSMAYSSDQAALKTSVNGSHQGENHTSSFNSYFNQSSKTQSQFGLNIGHTDSYLQKSLSYSKSMTSNVFGANLSGSALIHDEGIHFFSYPGDTLVLIKALGGEGASIGNIALAKIRSDGYGIIPNLMPYEENRLVINTRGAPLGFDIGDEDETIIVPTAGAVVKAEYKSMRKDKAAVLGRVKDVSGKPLPFGAQIYDGDNGQAGTVGQGGIVIVSLPEQYQPLKVSWETEGKKQSCIIQPWLIENKVKTGSGVSSVSLICKN